VKLDRSHFTHQPERDFQIDGFTFRIQWNTREALNYMLQEKKLQEILLRKEQIKDLESRIEIIKAEKKKLEQVRAVPFEIAEIHFDA